MTENPSPMAARYSETVRRSLSDLVEHGDAAARLVSRGKEAYDADEMLRFAAEDLLIRAGEAVHRIDLTRTGFVESHPSLELRRLKDTRNLVAHGYDIVDSEILWRILTDHLPRVVSAVREMLKLPVHEPLENFRQSAEGISSPVDEN
ncbi:MAG: DUF86 domain-containing protein [Propionibacteriaceae bacterium]|jgi:uncharacterized protein with HEPN domain|nr:DUF86 domain-containing protein [Propionibacteriaceae bacterium]